MGRLRDERRNEGRLREAGQPHHGLKGYRKRDCRIHQGILRQEVFTQLALRCGKALCVLRNVYEQKLHILSDWTSGHPVVQAMILVVEQPLCQNDKGMYSRFLGGCLKYN